MYQTTSHSDEVRRYANIGVHRVSRRKPYSERSGKHGEHALMERRTDTFSLSFKDFDSFACLGGAFAFYIAIHLDLVRSQHLFARNQMFAPL